MLSSVGFMRETSADYDWHGLRRGRTEFALFQYTLSGSGRLRVGGVEHEVGPGQAMLLQFPEANRYWLPTGQTWEFIYVSLNGSEVMRWWPDIVRGLGSLAALAPDSEPVRCAARTVTAVLAGLSDPFAVSAEAYALVMALAAAARRPVEDALKAAAIERAISHAEVHFAAPLDVEALAAIAGFSRYHFTRLFTAHTGTSPAAWVIDRRIREAGKLLRVTEMTLKEIAASCGFRDVHTFGKTFRQRTGQSPGNYRRSGV
jgi:AraC-like DNA-binding protein